MSLSRERRASLLALLLLTTGCAVGWGRASATTGGLWVDATRPLNEGSGEKQKLPAVYVRIDNEPPEPSGQSGWGAVGGVRIGWGAGQFGDLAFASGFSFEPNVEVLRSLPPFALSLSLGYAIEQVDYAGRFRNSYLTPTVTLVGGWAPTAWLGVHAGGGVLVDGMLMVGSADSWSRFGQRHIWGGRALAGLDVSVFRGSLFSAGVRLDLVYSQTGATLIRGTAASMRRIGGTAELYCTIF
jgi:hypothetical protein